MAKKRTYGPSPGLIPQEIRDAIKQEVLPPERKKKNGADKVDLSFFDTNQELFNPDIQAQPAPQPVTQSGMLTSMSRHIKRIVHELDPEEGITHSERIARTVVDMAARGDRWAAEFVRDSVEGRPGQAPKAELDIQETEERLSNVETKLLNSFSKKSNLKKKVH